MLSTNENLDEYWTGENGSVRIFMNVYCLTVRFELCELQLKGKKNRFAK